MTDLLVDLFPLFVIIGILVVFLTAARLDRRMSRGAHSAGPAEVPRPTPAGQEQVPWELRSIEDQVQLVSTHTTSAVPRYDLTATVNRLMTASGLTDPRDQLPMTASEADLATAITKIEARLELAPLTAEESHRK
ncbi:MAG: hypothetical protein GY724_28275 [Actinomycetia bacterium]|nr:hypothetical protein [Actinomycetes bacterium]